MTTSDRTALKQFAPSPDDGENTWVGHMADDVSATSGPEPMAKLSASANGLTLKSTRGTFSVPRSAIIRIGRGDFYPWFFSAVRIRHNLPGVPRSLQFKPLHLKPSDVVRRLRELGYPAG